ncbi:hypothetical protein QJ856_gp0141 [Tupanvirus deep ocean]|uniref:Uncharacterized protein n=2 Tax=Tupanvirus TaxID=2094720 RepID=A0AC62A9Z8_9VIRU|nr:hypothetical protein QJ856_gp0141 [Tupanvirus deep ocean]QKU34586.1 hypothetical protein [Tupanvirus deep ocean]
MNTVTILIILIFVSIGFIYFMGPEKFPFYNIYATRKNEFEKQQWVRLLDIFVLGPFAIWLGYKLQTDPTKCWGIIPYILYAYAFGTIVYNFTNYYNNIRNTR